VLAFAVQEALQELLQVGMHSVTVVTFVGVASSPHFSSHLLSQLCLAQRPHGPLCSDPSQFAPPPADPSQSDRHNSVQLVPCVVVLVVVHSSTHDCVQELSHSTDALDVHEVSHSL
jgi:hypothetical protein